MADADAFDLDTAISAQLDGALDEYCAELALPVAEVRARLATPAAEQRRARLAAARAAMQVVEPLDEISRRRLLAGATEAPAPVASSRGRAWLPRVVAVAAAAAVVVGVLVVVQPGSDDSAKSSGGGSATAGAPRGDLGNLGSLDQKGVEGLLRNGKPTPGSTVAPTSRSRLPEQSAAGGNAADASPPSDFAANATAATPEQVQACADQYASEGTVRFQASGTYRGQAAIVLGIDDRNRTIVFVVAAGQCSDVLYSASRRPPG
ncbi:MAG: hypothetical protein ACXV8T_12195 [Acidimicrobiia bacterium]